MLRPDPAYGSQRKLAIQRVQIPTFTHSLLGLSERKVLSQGL